MVRYIDELTDLEKLALIEMSYSRLSNFDGCEAQYFYTYIMGEPRGWGEHAALGSTIHSVLEHTDFTQPLSVDTMGQQFVQYRGKHDPENKISPNLIEAGHQIMADFVERHGSDEWHILGAEVPFAIVVGQALIVGYIDRVDKIGNCIHFIDYKSGKREVTYKGAPTDLQLGIYALAMAKAYPDHRIMGDLYYLRSGRMKGHEYTPEDLLAIENKVIDAVNKLIDRTDFHYTQNKAFCHWCDHAKSGACPVGVDRISR